MWGRLVLLVPLLAAGVRWFLLGTESNFDESSIPDGTGKVVIVTGANAGLGLATSKAFARKGYTVVMACRSKERGEAAVQDVQALTPKGDVLLELVDLAEPSSVLEFAASIASKFDRIDILINNAATMGTPEIRNSLGWESQMAIGHLGHFILTSRLFPLLKAAKGRIVNVASLNGFDLLHGFNIEDLNCERGKYDPFVAYGGVKRANMLFTYELNQRLAQHGITATVAHPGGTVTDLFTKAKGYASKRRLLYNIINNKVFQISFMTPEFGALSQIRAAVNASADAFVGPAYIWTGPPVRIGTSLRAWFNPFPFTAADAAALWRKSEEVTGERFPAA